MSEINFIIRAFRKMPVKVILTLAVVAGAVIAVGIYSIVVGGTFRALTGAGMSICGLIGFGLSPVVFGEEDLWE